MYFWACGRVGRSRRPTPSMAPRDGAGKPPRGFPARGGQPPIAALTRRRDEVVELVSHDLALTDEVRCAAVATERAVVVYGDRDPLARGLAGRVVVAARAAE